MALSTIPIHGEGHGDPSNEFLESKTRDRFDTRMD